MPNAPAAPAAALAPRSRVQDPARTSAQTSESSIAVVSLLLGRRREPRHWLIKAHGDPAGLAARLQGPLAAFSPSACAVPRAESGPDCLWQRAFSDCTALAKPDPPSKASYRYRLSLPSGRLASASVACWRRHGPGGPWQRRCGPMALATFLRHYGSPPEQSKQVHLY